MNDASLKQEDYSMKLNGVFKKKLQKFSFGRMKKQKYKVFGGVEGKRNKI